jgi:hypothetical protein
MRGRGCSGLLAICSLTIVVARSGGCGRSLGAGQVLGDDRSLDDANRRLDAAAVSHVLAAALASLGAGDREVLLLYAWADLSYEEISIALRLPVGTVRSRLPGARARPTRPGGRWGRAFEGGYRRWGRVL